MRRLVARLLAVLVLALALAVESAAAAGAAPSDCRPGPAGVSQKAYDTAEYVRSHGGAAPPGYVGGGRSRTVRATSTTRSARSASTT